MPDLLGFLGRSTMRQLVRRGCAGVTAATIGFALGLAHTALAGPLPTPTGTPPPTPSGLFRIAGHVAAEGCNGDRAGITVRISPERSVVTSADGEFVFEDLHYGYYYLTFEPNCP